MDFLIPDETGIVREQRVSTTPLEESQDRRTNEPSVVEHSNNIVVSLEPRVRWGSLLGGCVVAMGFLLLLTALGSALGFSLANHTWQMNEDMVKGLMTSEGVWSVFSLFFMFFIASMVATKVTNRPDRGGAVLHGAITWALLLLLLPLIANTGVDLGREGSKEDPTSGASDLHPAPSSAFNEAELSHNLGLDDPDQVSVRLADPRMPIVIAALTGMSDNEAQMAVTELQTRVKTVKDNPAAINAEVQHFLAQLIARSRTETPEAAVNPHALETGSWIFFGLLALTLFVSILGAFAGLPNRYRWRRTLFIRA